MKKILGTFATLFFVLMIFGFVRDNNPEFKARCAAYQSGIVDTLSTPDKLVCLTWYQLKG